MAAGVGASDPAVTGYVPLFHDLLRGELACRPSHRPGCRKLALDNLAVGGATSATLVRDQLSDAVTELEARNHDRRPNNDVKVITIDIGGNDVFTVVPLCSAGPTPECLGLIDTTLRTFAANFTTTLAQLRAAAGPGLMIIAMTYYNPLPSCRLSALAPLADNVLEGAPGFDGRLNGLIRASSAANGVAVPTPTASSLPRTLWVVPIVCTPTIPATRSSPTYSPRRWLEPDRRGHQTQRPSQLPGVWRGPGTARRRRLWHRPHTGSIIRSGTWRSDAVGGAGGAR